MARRVTVAARVVSTLAGVAVAVAGCSSATTSDASWALAQSSPASSTVIVEYFHGSCDSLTGATVRGSATSVRITLRLTTKGDECADDLRETFVRVRLGAPLGVRAVLGSCRVATHSLCQPASKVPASSEAFLRVVGP